MKALEIVKYTPRLHHELQARAATLKHDHPLRFRAFVDYYYASSDYAELFLAMDADGSIAGVQGAEWMPFREDEKTWRIGFGSNFHAFTPGAGAYLLAHFHHACDAGLVFGGSDDMDRLIARARWRRFDGIKCHYLNRRYNPAPHDGWLRRTLKRLIKAAPNRKCLSQLAGNAPPGITAREIREFTPKVLAFTPGFRFRFAPDVEYLNWRFGPQVPFLRHRAFAVQNRGRAAGYVVLLDNPDDIILVHADGSDPATLAHGVLAGIAGISNGARDRRQVLIATSHPAMRAVYESAGFRTRDDWNRPFAIGKIRGGFDINVPVSEWMVSFGWGDNAARPPFIKPGATAQPSPIATTIAA